MLAGVNLRQRVYSIKIDDLLNRFVRLETRINSLRCKLRIRDILVDWRRGRGALRSLDTGIDQLRSRISGLEICINGFRNCLEIGVDVLRSGLETCVRNLFRNLFRNLPRDTRRISEIESKSMSMAMTVTMSVAVPVTMIMAIAMIVTMPVVMVMAMSVTMVVLMMVEVSLEMIVTAELLSFGLMNAGMFSYRLNI